MQVTNPHSTYASTKRLIGRTAARAKCPRAPQPATPEATHTYLLGAVLRAWQERPRRFGCPRAALAAPRRRPSGAPAAPCGAPAPCHRIRVRLAPCAHPAGTASEAELRALAALDVPATADGQAGGVLLPCPALRTALSPVDVAAELISSLRSQAEEQLQP